VQNLKPDDPRTIGPYTIIGRIGEGGMGCVYLGLHEGKLAAVKMMSPLYGGIPEFRLRFRREIAMARKIKPRFTARILGHDAEGMKLWYASEYVTGPNLAEAVQASLFADAALVNLIYSLCQALMSVHEAGIIHRDFKPANIMLGPDGVKVVDFGIAADRNAQALTMTGQVIGTASYMPPEQIAGGKPTTAWDVFALGCVIVYAATGHTPYTGENPMKIMLAISNPLTRPDLSGVPQDLLALVTSCLQHDASKRPTLEAIMRQLPKPQIATVASTKWMPQPVSTKVDAATRIAKGLAPTRKEVSPKPAPAAEKVVKPTPKKNFGGVVGWLTACIAVGALLGWGGTFLDDPETPAPTPTPRPSAAQPATVEVPPPTFTVSSLKGKGDPKVVKVTAVNRGLHLKITFSGTAEQRKAAIAKSCLKVLYTTESVVSFHPDSPKDDTPSDVIEFRGALDFPGDTYFMPICRKDTSITGGQWLGKNKVPHDGFFGDGATIFPVVDAYTKGGKLKVVLPGYNDSSDEDYKAMCLKTAGGQQRVASFSEAVNRNRKYVVLTFDAKKGVIYTDCSVDKNDKGAAIP
jgi:serine/threonine protein kinase